MLALMFATDQNITPEDAGAGVIVSPDTRRGNRVPPGQSRTRKWPILDTSGAPPMALERWKFSIGALLANPREWDCRCVTRWSRLGNMWEGVSTRQLMELAGCALPEAEIQHQSSVGRFSGRGRAGGFFARWAAACGGTWLAGTADRAATIGVEEREVDRGPEAVGSRPGRILGTERLPHA